ncbi:MAG: hypothetical protein IKH76_04925, partial [Clostridiales bacterium]|nr:hypothetical protein [Clostridiales bacterium]
KVEAIGDTQAKVEAISGLQEKVEAIGDMQAKVELSGFIILNSVDQQERLSVRKDVHDLLDVK